MFSKKKLSLFLIILSFLLLFFNFAFAEGEPACPNGDSQAEVDCAPGDTILKCVVEPKADSPVYKDYDCLLGTNIPRTIGLGAETTDIRNNIRTVILYSLGFLGVLCVIMVIYGGLVWLTSQGNSDKIKKGRDILIWSAIGAIVISIAWTITAYMLKAGEMVS